MGYRMNLPPRYVQLCSSPHGRGNEPKRQSKRRVHFEEESNKTKEISRVPKNAVWYSALDYSLFSRNFKYDKKESMVPRKPKATLIVGKRAIPPMEELQTFSTGGHVSRRLLIQSILMHQASCRARGYTDPDGYSFLSKALSKPDRKQAWQAAQVNAYEADCFRKEDSSMSLSQLFLDYYVESIHPYLNEPIVFLSKVLLCECD